MNSAARICHPAARSGGSFAGRSVGGGSTPHRGRQHGPRRARRKPACSAAGPCVMTIPAGSTVPPSAGIGPALTCESIGTSATVTIAAKGSWRGTRHRASVAMPAMRMQSANGTPRIARCAGSNSGRIVWNRSHALSGAGTSAETGSKLHRLELGVQEIHPSSRVSG